MNDKDAQTQEGQVSEDAGVSAKETAGLEAGQTSDDQGTTSPQDATDELTKIFAIPGRPDLKLTGQEVANAIGRAELAAKFQGDADKSTAKAQEAIERAVKAEAKLQALEQDQRIVTQLENAGLLGAKPTASDRSTEDWLGEEPAESQLGAKEVARILKDTNRQTDDERLAEIEARVTEKVRQDRQNEREGDQQLKQYEAILTAEKRTRRAALSQAYPTLSEDRLEEIAILSEAAQSAWTDAQTAAAQGDKEVALQKIHERDAYTRKGNRLEAEAIVAQDAAEQKAEYDQQLETGDYKGVTVPDELSDDTPREMIFDPAEKKKRRGLIARLVADKGEAKQRAQIAQGD